MEGDPAVVLVLRPHSLPVTVGGGFSVAAYNLPPDAEVPVGVYDVVKEDYLSSELRLHESGVLESEADGAAFATLTLDPSYAPGKYCVVVVSSPAYEPSQELSSLGAVRCFEVE
jgi:hypothetical protein